ncbi:hypothetical protein HIM_03196 [Hirsutella minnesotensis 3608]|nr:hypothetical protein HIM_03196 [Hirsutella minnesotensis 3608]
MSRTPSAHREPGREHIPAFPKGWVVLRFFQLAFAVVSIGPLAYVLSVQPILGAFIAIFFTVATLVVASWLVVAHLRAPKAYNYWASLALDLVLWVAWTGIAGWCILEAIALGFLREYQCHRRTFDEDFHYYHDGVRPSCDGGYLSAAYVAVYIAIAFLLTSQFVFFLVAWIGDAVVISRHRRAGLGNHPVVPGSAADPIPVQVQAHTKGDPEAALPPHPATLPQHGEVVV